MPAMQLGEGKSLGVVYSMRDETGEEMREHEYAMAETHRIGEVAARHIACGQIIATLERLQHVNGVTAAAAVALMRAQLYDDDFAKLSKPEQEWYLGVVDQAEGEFMSQYAGEMRN